MVNAVTRRPVVAASVVIAAESRPPLSSEATGTSATCIAVQLAGAGVPYGEGVHAVEAVQGVGSPVLPGAKDDLGVGAGGEPVVVGEVAAQVSEVVDLAVVGDGEVCAGHRLGPGISEVEDA